MNLELLPIRVSDSEDSRVLGAFQFVDATTGLPAILPAKVNALDATLVGPPPNDPVPMQEHSVKILQNPSGLHVILNAPFFEQYTATFRNPLLPTELTGHSLRLRLAVQEAGASYLPQEFFMDLPRSLNPADADSVFKPLAVPLFRSPGAAVQDGWTVLRVRVTEADETTAIPGALVRVFRSPRAVNDLPIGEGMTDWRGDISGEALVPLTSLQRFFPGNGANVFESEQPIEFEAARDSGFTGAQDQLPNVSVVRAQPAAQGLQIVAPATPVLVRAGREYAVHLAFA